MSEVYELGVVCCCNNTAACLFHNGTLIFAVEEERLDRDKHSAAFPVKSMAACLEYAGITPLQVNRLSVGMNPFALRYKMADAIRFFPYSVGWLFAQADSEHSLTDLLFFRRKLVEIGFRCDVPIRFVDHHTAHAAQVFFSSSFEESLVITFDGMGVYASGAVFSGRNNGLARMETTRFPHSLGYVYNAITQYLGFWPNSEEGSVMALASYGNPEYLSALQDVVCTKNGRIIVDQAYFTFLKNGFSRTASHLFSSKFTQEFGAARKAHEPLGQHHKDMATSLQDLLKGVVEQYIDFYLDKSTLKNICLAGGIFLNCDLNSHLRLQYGENLYVCPVPYDAGTAIGSVLETVCREGANVILPESMYLGPESGRCEHDMFHQPEKFTIIKGEEELYIPLVQALNADKIIAVCRGRMEFGARSLGNRTLLASARDTKIRDRLNRIKRRAMFRPFAPIIMEDFVGDYFSPDTPSKYMQYTYTVHEKMRHKVPGIVHHDGTARIQTVSQCDNGQLYGLLRRYYEETGIPMLINTSFNMQGPIVCSMSDAIGVFLDTEIDVLWMDGFMVTKQ